MKSLILYPHQLFEADLLPKVQRVYLVEEPILFGVDPEYPIRVHKQKLVLHRASMRRYAEEVLWPAGFEVEYIELSSDVVTDTAIVKAAFDGCSEIYVIDPLDIRLTKRIEVVAQSLEVHVPLHILENPNFYLKNKDIAQYSSTKTPYSFVDFYQYMRERFDVLIDNNYKPYGGKWTFEDDDQAKINSGETLPGLASYGDNQYVREAVTYIELKFPDNPGRTDSFVWPTNRDEAVNWMTDFFKHRLFKFAEYSKAVDSEGAWLYHSALSACMNIGLLSSRDVVEAVLEFSAKTKKEVSLENLELFVQKVIGWREYMRLAYVTHGDSIRTKNSLGNNKKLTASWYDGTTGLLPLDDVIKKVNNLAYAHQSERLMIVGNLMLLSDIDPSEVYRWFMSLFIDAYDWVVVPNVYGLSQFADNGLISDRPAIYSSSAILDVSNYQKDRWCDVWDGLFWRFVDGRRMMLKKFPRFGSVLVGRYDTMDASRKRIIGYRAQDFLDTCTTD